MPEQHDYLASVEAAERAAEAGDFARAESLLREGLRTQERAVGPAHPDLANTLNNLAVVCETNGRLEDAEQFYRRAVQVATAALGPTDERVVQSRANLEDFCAAHGVVLDRRPKAAAPAPAAPRVAAVPSPSVHDGVRPAPAADRPAPRAAAAPVPPARPAVHVAAPSPPTKGAPIGLIGALVILAVAATATVGWLWLPAGEPPQATPTAAAPAPDAPIATPTPAPPPVAQPPAPESLAQKPPGPVPSPPEAAPAVRAPEPEPAPEPPSNVDRATAAADIRVVTADLCRTLDRTAGAWRCVPVGAAGPPGQVSYYTRIAAARPLRLEHRWYRNGTLTRTAQLEIGANPREGYRTFSRQTLTPGQWRIELRAPDGAVLHELTTDVQ